MLQAAFEKGWLDPARAILESLVGIRRTRAGFIVTYFAEEAVKPQGSTGLLSASERIQIRLPCQP